MKMENNSISANTSESITNEIIVNNQQHCDASQGISTDEWPRGVYRPRGALARALYQKHLSDNHLKNIDKDKWYEADLKGLPESLSSRFVQLNVDEDTLEFLKRAEQQSDWIFTQIWHAIAKAFLGLFMTQTSINGLLGRGSMFVISKEQFEILTDWNSSWILENSTLLDLGAGDGATTARIAPLFSQTFATEVSYPMKKILQKLGFTLLDIDTWHENKQYDMITCLNLLDRCDRPMEILKNIKNSLKPNGKLLIALVLPFSPYVESGTKDHKPHEYLDVYGDTFETQVFRFWRNVLIPLGLELIKWSRVPYLCEGDLRQSYYYLNDALFIVQKKDCFDKDK